MSARARHLDPTHIKELTSEEFEKFRVLILEQAGIHLNDTKRGLLYGRVARRVREVGLRSFGEYFELINRAKDGLELAHMLDLITTNETHFFREPSHFAYLDETLLPRWRAAGLSNARSRTVRVWSAGCSTGEEPYSIAMTLLAHFPESSGWMVRVHATDISTRVLDVARSATWPIERAAEIPAALLRRFMLRGVGPQSGWLRASPALRDVVRIERMNLNDETYPGSGPFDLIFCRNVLIYFEPKRRQRVLERLLARLAPGGRLFMGHAESAQGTSERLSVVCPTGYARASEDGDVGMARTG
jgi:chemotaxis protein methyltransferase CheR